MKKIQGGSIVNKKSVSALGVFLAVFCFFDAEYSNFLPVPIRWTLFLIAILLVFFSNFITKKEKPDH
ncbi:hypothetical protein [Oceanobacillus sp. J11TS1]|uniref:hypothetical protein n=1 Tax=Oceanobacillus sp. J11TS1 TaxID=2807191 RepID=UPI001B1B9EA8|nr:hypothetical protein [Oceanobacillus sp. J11TS1]GIO23313.1 hypothetical protein J11TS1_18940 [Oceanobacillus sp. J11TS1]